MIGERVTQHLDDPASGRWIKTLQKITGQDGFVETHIQGSIDC